MRHLFAVRFLEYDGPKAQLIAYRYLHVRLLIHRQAFVVWSRSSNMQSQFLRDLAWSSSRLCVTLACQTIEQVRDNFDQQRFGPIWYTLHCRAML